MLEFSVRPRLPTDLRLTLSALRRGSGDPHLRFEPGGAWWAALTPDGPGTVHLAGRAGGEIRAAAWGPGAGWLAAAVPDLVGARESLDGWAPHHPLLRGLHARLAGFRVPRTGLVLDALLPAVLEQRVTGGEASRSFRDLLYRYGSPAPGPDGGPPLRVPPSAETLAALPSWAWHRAGVEEARARVVRAAARVAHRMEEATAMPPDDALRRLRAVPGVGPWTAAEVAQRAFGDPDAVSVGDLHLPHLVGWALAGHRTDDDGMLALLEPYRGHRYRVTRLLELGGAPNPRFGPRYAPLARAGRW